MRLPTYRRRRVHHRRRHRQRQPTRPAVAASATVPMEHRPTVTRVPWAPAIKLPRQRYVEGLGAGGNGGAALHAPPASSVANHLARSHICRLSGCRGTTRLPTASACHVRPYTTTTCSIATSRSWSRWMQPVSASWYARCSPACAHVAWARAATPSITIMAYASSPDRY